MSIIPSIFGPDKINHVYVPMSFIPVNEDNSFVTTAKRNTGPKKQLPAPDTHSGCLVNSSPQAWKALNERTFFIATVEQQQASEEKEEEKLKQAKISNLWGFVTVLHDQVRRTIPKDSEVSLYRPSIGEVKYAIDQIRNQTNKAKLTKDWEYGFLLFGLLDLTSHHSFRSFHSFEDREASERDPGLHLDEHWNPYGTLVHSRQPEIEPYLTTKDLPAFLQQVQDFNKHRSVYSGPPSQNLMAPSNVIASVDVSTTPASVRWVPGKPHNAGFFYDEALPAGQLLKASPDGFPPDGMDLSDAWVVKIVRSDLRKEERFKRWPAVFSSKYLVSNYKNKGQASKTLQSESNEWYYDVVFGRFQMCGEEGVKARATRTVERNLTAKNEVTIGQRCAVQTNTYTRITGSGTKPSGNTGSKPSGSSASKPSAAKTGYSFEPKRMASAALDLAKGKRKTGDAVPASTVPPKKIKTEEGESDRASMSSNQAPKFQVQALSDSEEEDVAEAEEDSATVLREENAKLRNRLEQAEGKLVVMANTMSIVHGTVEPLIARTSQAAVMLKLATKLQSFLEKQALEQLEGMKAFWKGNAKAVKAIVAPAEDAIHEMNENFPALANILFYHDTASLEKLEQWKMQYGKLSEKGDADVDFTGTRLDAIKGEVTAADGNNDEQTGDAGEGNAGALSEGNAGALPEGTVDDPS